MKVYIHILFLMVITCSFAQQKEIANLYSPVEGKTLGIWVTDNPKNYYQAKQYGFTKVFLTPTDNPEAAINAGFQKKDLMLQLTDPEQKILKGIGAYYIDEPFENHSKIWTKEKIIEIAKTVTPAPLYIGSYRWPNASLMNFFNSNGSDYKDLLDTSLPIYIMCDEYHGNCSGNTDDFWDEFRNVYGKEKNISNWMNNIVNNGDGSSSVNCFYKSGQSTDFNTLFKKANEFGLKELWLYAAWEYWNEDNLKKFAEAAVNAGWLTRKVK